MINRNAVECEHTLSFTLLGLNIVHITPKSDLKRKQEMTLEQMQNNQQVGTIKTTLPPGGDLTVLFQWVGESVGATLNYTWQLKEEDKSDQEVIALLKKGECSKIGSVIDV